MKSASPPPAFQAKKLGPNDSNSLLKELKDQFIGCAPGADRVKKTMQFLKTRFLGFYWVGVYVYRNGGLHVGPYVGPTTEHVFIRIGQGVCGTAVAENRNQIVDDVRSRSNYLACNLETRSEIVVLVRRESNGDILGQIDIDATTTSAFDTSFEQFLNEIAKLIAPDMELLATQQS